MRNFINDKPYLIAYHKDMEDVVVVYEEMKGWESNTTQVETFDQLPEAAQAYVQMIEKRVGVPGTHQLPR